jgi:hypothetical protein
LPISSRQFDESISNNYFYSYQFLPAKLKSRFLLPIPSRQIRTLTPTTQRAELNIEVSPKTAKFEKFVFPPIFKNCLLTFLWDAIIMAHPCKYQFNWIENITLSTNHYHSFNNWKLPDLIAVLSCRCSWQPRSTIRSGSFCDADV